MLKNPLCLAMLWAFALIFPWASQAAPDHQPEYVHINLHSNVSAIAPGQPFQIVIEQQIAPDWHTYWINPGDSGIPLSASWTLPQGGSAGPLLHPIPSRIPFGPLLNFGYANRALWVTTITPPKELNNETYTAQVRLDWLVCKDICLPEGGTYQLVLPVVDNTPIQNEKTIDIWRDLTLTHPTDADWQATYGEDNGQLIIAFTPTGTATVMMDDGATIEFYPEAWGLMQNVAPQTMRRGKDGGYELVVTRGERPLGPIGAVKGLMVSIDQDGARRGYEVTVNPGPGVATTKAPPEPPAPETTAPEAPGTMPAGINLLGVLALAVIGGLILNLMPCVFPVLSLKVLSLVKLSAGEQKTMRRHGLFYAAGVITMFLIIGGALIIVQHLGSAVGWGFQLQSPVMVAALTVLFVMIGLNLMGWFEFDINPLIPARWQSTELDHSPAGSFATGLLATLVATPCTAPFMGAALGVALTQSPIIGLIVFTALGVGLALPFVVITFVPSLQRLLPRPGAWMLTLRQSLAFPMFLTAIWLVWVITQQTGPNGAALALLGVLSAVLLVWMSIRDGPQGIKNAVQIGAFLALLSAIAAQYTLPKNTAALPSTAHQAFSPLVLDQALATPYPVFVNMTAAWCITCKVNEQVAIETTATRALFSDQNVQYIYGDWTNYDDQITAFLARFSRQGVPLYVVYPKAVNGVRPEPKVLPQLLNETIIRDAILTPATGE